MSSQEHIFFVSIASVAASFFGGAIITYLKQVAKNKADLQYKEEFESIANSVKLEFNTKLKEFEHVLTKTLEVKKVMVQEQMRIVKELNKATIALDNVMVSTSGPTQEANEKYHLLALLWYESKFLLPVNLYNAYSDLLGYYHDRLNLKGPHEGLQKINATIKKEINIMFGLQVS